VIEDLALEVGQEEVDRGGAHDAAQREEEERDLGPRQLEAALEVLRQLERLHGLETLVRVGLD